MIGLHYKYKPWEIDELSYIEYKDDMKEIGLDLNFQSIKGLLGNAYAQDAMSIISASNPLNFEDKEQKKPKRMTKDMALALIKTM